MWQKDVDSYSFIVNCGDEHLQKKIAHKTKANTSKIKQENKNQWTFVVVTCNFSMESLTFAQTNKHTHTKQKLQKNNIRISKLLFLPSIITTYNFFMESSTLAQK